MKKVLFVIGLTLLCGASIIACKKDCFCDTTYINADGSEGTTIKNLNVGPATKQDCEALSKDTTFTIYQIQSQRHIVCHH